VCGGVRWCCDGWGGQGGRGGGGSVLWWGRGAGDADVGGGMEAAVPELQHELGQAEHEVWGGVGV
jgi:hypothetical protein